MKFINNMKPTNKKHLINHDDTGFWHEIEQEFKDYTLDTPSYVLSPRQARLHQLAYLRVPKFRHILSKIEVGYNFYNVGKNLFEQRLHEWHSLGLLDLETLEKTYKERLFAPEFMNPLPNWNDIINELRELITKRELSARFARLWPVFIKRVHIVSFLIIFDPYDAANKSAEANESSEVEKYIFAIWLIKNGYNGKRGEKSRLISRLAHALYEITESNNIKAKQKWQYTHYNSLLRTKGEKNPLLRTVTDMPFETVKEYASDGAFTTKDFPELFSAT